MAAAGVWWHRAMVVLMVCCAPAAQAASQARLVIVPSQRTQAAQALGAFAEALQKPLADAAVVLPTAAYTEAARKALLGPNLASGSAAAVLLGAQVGASHALYLRATTEQLSAGKRRKRARERITLWVTLVDAVNGETMLSQRYVAGPRGLAGDDVSAHVVADIKTALQQAMSPTVVAQSDRPSPAAVSGGTTARSEDAEPARSPAADKHDQAQPTPLPPVPTQMAVAPPEDPYSQAIMREHKAAHGPSMNLGLRAQLGLMVFARQATLSSLGVPKMQYGVSKKGSSPAFSRGTLQLEAFPVLMVRRNRPRRLYDGIGLHFGGALGWPKTRTSARNTAKSLISNIRTGLTLRYPLGYQEKSPEVAFRLGYARYAFAMPQGAIFPNISYSSVYLSLSTLVPLATDKVALTAEAALMPALHLGNQGHLLGVHRGGGVGAWIEAGLKISPIKHMDILVLFDWEHYGANFVGSTLLPGSSTQYSNVSLREVLLGGRVAVGMTF